MLSIQFDEGRPMRRSSPDLRSMDIRTISSRETRGIEGLEGDSGDGRAAFNGFGGKSELTCISRTAKAAVRMSKNAASVTIRATS